MRKRWRALLVLSAIFLLIALTEVASAQSARVLARSCLALGRFGFILKYQSVHLYLPTRRLLAESVVITPAGAAPEETAVTAKSVELWTCSERGAAGYCFALQQIAARMVLGRKGDESDANDQTSSGGKTILSANDGHLYGIFRSSGKSEWKLRIDSVEIFTPLVRWSGAVSAEVQTYGGDWRITVSVPSRQPDVPEPDNRKSEAPRVLITANANHDGWEATITGNTFVYPRGGFARRSLEPWHIEDLNVAVRGQRNIIRVDRGTLRIFGVNLSGRTEYDALSGAYEGELVARGDLSRAIFEQFDVLLSDDAADSQWALQFEGSPEGANIHWNASPPVSFFAALPAVDSAGIVLQFRNSGEPHFIRDLTLTTPHGNYKATGFYDGDARSLYLAGFLNLSSFQTPGLPLSLSLSSWLNVRADFGLPEPAANFTFNNGRVNAGKDFALDFAASMRWSPKKWTGEGFLESPSHSVRFKISDEKLNFVAKSGDAEYSIAQWLGAFVPSLEQSSLSTFASTIFLSEYELTGVYHFADRRAKMEGFAKVSHPQTDLWTSFNCSIWSEGNKFFWKVSSEDTTVAFTTGIRMSGGFVAEGTSQALFAFSASLEGDGLQLEAVWRDKTLRADLRGNEFYPRIISTALSFVRIPISVEAAFFLRQTLLKGVSLSAKYRPEGTAVDLRASLNAENPLLGIQAQISEIRYYWDPQAWSTALTGSAAGQGFEIEADRIVISPEEIRGQFRAEASELDLSGLQALLFALGGKLEAQKWLSGTITGNAQIVASSAKAGVVTLEVYEWRDGPIPIRDLWLAGSLSAEDLIISGKGNVFGIPVGLSVAVSHPYELSREGTFVVSAENLPLKQLPFGRLPDWLREANVTGYLQAVTTARENRLSGEGVLSQLTAGPFLPRDLVFRIEGDFENARVFVRSDDNLVAADAAIGLRPPFPVAGTFSVDGRGALSDTVTNIEFSATGSLRAALVPFSIERAEAVASRFRASILGEEWALSEPATVHTEDGRTFTVSGLNLKSAHGELAFSGQVVKANTVGFSRATLDARLPLALLRALHSEFSAEGVVDTTLSWGDDPSVLPRFGFLEARAETVNHPSLPDAFRDVFARVRLEDDTFRIEEGQFVYLDGTGRFDAFGVLSLNRLDYFAGSFSLENFRIPYSTIRDSYASAFLQLTGTAEELYITGDISVSGGEMRLVPSMMPTYFQTPIPVRLNLTVSLSEPIRVISEGFQSEMSGSLGVRGTVDLPLIFGHLALAPGGAVRVAGKSFSIQAGDARFTGYSLLPEISLRAAREEPPYTVYLLASGTPPDLIAEFSSSPPLPTPSILSLLATGRTLEEIQAISPDEPASFLALGLPGLLSAGLEEHLFDRVSTRSTTIGGKKLPVMTLGKAFGERYFTQYTFDVSSGTPEEISFSYRLHPWEFQVVQERSQSPAFTVTYRGATIRTAHEESATYTLVGIHLEIPPAHADLLKPLQNLIKYRVGERVTRAQILALRSPLKAFLISRGYLGARVSPNISVNEENKTLSANIAVEPGKVKRVFVVAPPDLPAEAIAQKLSDFWGMSPDDDIFLRAAIRNLPAILENEGWQMQSCEAEIVRGEDTQALFTLRAEPLPRVGWVHILPEGEFNLPRDLRMRLRKGAVWKPLAFQEALSGWVQRERARGYREFQASVALTVSATSAQEPSAVEVTLTVKPGPLYQIREIATLPPEAASETLKRAMARALAVDRSASTENLLNLRQIISRHFREEGYADAYVVAQEKPAPEYSVDLIFRVDTGLPVVVNSVLVEGNLSASEKAHFSALLSRFAGHPLSPSLEAQIRKVLSTAGFPSAYEIRVRRDEPRDNVIPAIVEIRLIRAAPLTYSASLGYGSASRATFALFGRRQGVLTPWQSLGFSGSVSRALKNAEITFDDPRFRFRDSTIRLRFFAERAANSDLVVHSRLVGIEMTKTAEAARSRFTGSLQLQRLSYSGGTLRRPDTAFVINLAYLRDRRDSLFNPRTGDLLSLSARFGQDLPIRKPLFGKATLHFVRAVPVAPTVSLFSRLFAGFGFHLPLGERFFYTRAIGIRGFNPDRLNPRDQNDNPIGGQAIFLAGLEARWRAYKNWGTLAFVDAGGLFERPRDFHHADIALSVGAGFFYISPLGPIRLEYQIPLKPQDRAGKNELFLGFAFAY